MPQGNGIALARVQNFGFQPVQVGMHFSQGEEK
jgi:urease beta subunit